MTTRLGNKILEKVAAGITAAVLLVCVYPVWFLLAGSVCGKAQLQELLGPALAGAEGMACLPVVPVSPTLRWWAQLLLDSPEFFVLFWNSVKLS